MPTTPCAQIDYPCLEDPFQRHWIQDLAEDADALLARMNADLRRASRRPKAQMRRSSPLQAFNNGAAAPLTYVLTDYSNGAVATTGTGTIAPDEPGLYFVDVSVTPGSPFTVSDAAMIDVQVGGVTKLARKWNLNNTTSPMKLSGVVLVPQIRQLITARFQVIDTVAKTLNVSSRFAAHHLVRCGAPLNANPYMVQTVNPWTAVSGCTIALSNVESLSTPTSMRVTTSASNWVVNSEFIPATAAANYMASAWFRRVSAGTTTATVSIDWYNGAVFLSSSAGTPVATVSEASWTKAWVGPVAAPATTTQAKIKLSCSANAGTYIDDAEMLAACA